MKGLYIFLVFIFIGGLVLFVVSCSMGTTLEDYRAMVIDEENYEEKTIEYDYDGADFSLDFAILSNNVTVIYDDTDKIMIHYYENIKRDEVTSSYLEGKLTFKITRKWYFNINFLPLFTSEFDDMEITIPKDIVFEDFKFQLFSGSLKIPKLTAINTVDIDVSSGQVDVANVKALTFKINVASGRIKLSNAEANTIAVRVFSGNLDFTNLNVTTIDIDVSSGNTNINTIIAVNINIDISSGTIRLNNVMADHIKAEISSGTLALGLVDGELYSYDLKANSGSIRINGVSEGKNYQVNGTKGDIYARISSGTINITY